MKPISSLSRSDKAGNKEGKRAATPLLWKSLIWAALAAAIGAPIALAAASPLLAWRDPIYITAGFAGIIALGLLLVQPLIIGGLMPGLPGHQRRPIHRWIGAALLLSVLIHVGGLWITSPPDVIDALLFASPTPFSDWGVIAMWSLFLTALLAIFRKRLRLRPQMWRRVHSTLAIVIVVSTALHAILIEGTMETISKAALCLAVLAATWKAIVRLRLWATQNTKPLSNR